MDTFRTAPSLATCLTAYICVSRPVDCSERWLRPWCLFTLLTWWTGTSPWGTCPETERMCRETARVRVPRTVVLSLAHWWAASYFCFLGRFFFTYMYTSAREGAAGPWLLSMRLPCDRRQGAGTLRARIPLAWKRGCWTWHHFHSDPSCGGLGRGVTGVREFGRPKPSILLTHTESQTKAEGRP